MSNDAFGGLMPDWLGARAALTPERTALVTGSERLTFAQLDRRADAASRRLAGLGVGVGDRVALLLRNGTPMVELVHGVGRIGAVLVPLNVRLSPAEVAWQLEDSRARLLLFDAPNADKATLARSGTRTSEPSSEAPISRAPAVKESESRDQSVISPCPAVRERSAGLPAPQSRETSPHGPGGEGAIALDVDEYARLPEAAIELRARVDLAAVHTIVYTSGTTGRPKGAMLTYGNHWWNAVGSVLNLGLHDDDRWLAVLPLFHVGGLSILLRSVIYGIPAIIHDSFDPDLVNRAIDEESVTIVSAVATMLARMLDQRHDRPYPPTLRHVLLGGGPVSLPLLERCRRLGVPVVQTYGLTETASQAVTLPPADALRKVGSAGKPLLPTELRIDLGGRPAPPGETGEILVRGPSVTPGYADRPEETARVLRDGWLHTGDVGYMDQDGYLFVLDRRSDLIVSGGENVYPAEIEASLLAHPSVSDAGVTGAHDAVWGRVPIAFVVLRPGATATADDLLSFCRARLARFKVPARISIVEALPRNAAGKLLRNRLSP